MRKNNMTRKSIYIIENNYIKSIELFPNDELYNGISINKMDDEYYKKYGSTLDQRSDRLMNKSHQFCLRPINGNLFVIYALIQSQKRNDKYYKVARTTISSTPASISFAQKWELNYDITNSKYYYFTCECPHYRVLINKYANHLRNKQNDVIKERFNKENDINYILYPEDMTKIRCKHIKVTEYIQEILIRCDSNYQSYSLCTFEIDKQVVSAEIMAFTLNVMKKLK